MTERLARAASRHPWRTIGLWLLAVLIAVALAAALLPGALTTKSSTTNNPESTRAERLLATHFAPTSAAGGELIVIHSNTATVDQPTYRRFVAALAGDAVRTGGASRLRTWYSTHDRSLVSPDRHATLITTFHRDDVVKLIGVAQRFDGRNGFAVAITGDDTLGRDFDQLSQSDLRTGELQIGMPAALVVLLLVFGAVVAGLIPLLMAVLSITIAIGLTAVFAHVFTLSVFVVNMISGMGLALGIDYALFVVSRYREERSRGREQFEAIGASGATASRAVLFSGSMFSVALVGMLLVPNSVLKSLALGAILVAIVSVLAALTLLPALLGLLGDRVNSLRLPIVGRNAERASQESRVWGPIIRGVMRRPATSLVLAAALLLAASVPVLDLRIGHNGVSTLPDRFVAKKGLLALQRWFPSGRNDPALIAIQGNVRSPQIRAAVGKLRTELAANRDFGPSQTRVDRSGTVQAIAAPVAGDAEGGRAVAAVRRLRHELIPHAFAGTGATVLVGGKTADDVDYFDTDRNWLPIVFAFVLGLSFLLLTLVFRSLVVALKACLLNLLSVGAAYGLLVLVFEKGYLHHFFGFRQVDTIEAWVPLFLFSVLFGLSMDYQVFLLSRIRERYTATGDNDGSVEFGIGSTARLITGAALIIVAVFSGFAAGQLVMFQQMGFGIAVALILDATIVRSVVLPAAMKLLGNANWYLPRWLQWLPELQVERGAA
jgi:putative drug exporter of the RND superfamily